MNDFDKIFRQKLENFTETPPPEVFEKVKNNYPKRSFGDVVSAYKYYLISAAVVVGVVATIVAISLPKIDDSADTLQTLNTSPDAIESNASDNGNSLNFNNTISDQEPNLQIKSSELITQSNKIDVLDLNDTIICGNELLIEGLDVNRTKHSSALNLSKTASGVKVFCQSYGRQTLYLMNGNSVADSVRITFVKPEEITATASKSQLCYGEALQVNISGNASKISWNDDNYSVRKADAASYEISGLVPGNNSIVLTVGQPACASVVKFDVRMMDKPDYLIEAEANYCSRNNGRIVVTSGSSQINYCKIKSSISRNGTFTGLAGGIYPIEINYANSCLAFDTVKIEDRESIKASFSSRRSAFNDMTYEFQNATRVSNIGNSHDIEYEWYVNGEFKMDDYNFEYDFPSSGSYKVELVCVSGECESRYSETIAVTSTNFRIPNIFTPNGDGIGDLFEVQYRGNLQSYEISIYTKGGQLVFQSTSLDNSWNGKINGNNEAAEGVYFYVITATGEQGESITQKGSVQLKRN